MKMLHPSECTDLLADSSVLCIDVRENFEYEAENLGWLNIPMNHVLSYLQEEQISNNRRIVLLCNTGKRASALGNLLETEGVFSDIWIVEEGMQGWSLWKESQHHQ
ncbi:MAG: hypothetical protein RL432_431 [Bacteroidota bacterium]|jgi:rhodanese-related sulfurtransferase